MTNVPLSSSRERLETRHAAVVPFGGCKHGDFTAMVDSQLPLQERINDALRQILTIIG